MKALRLVPDQSGCQSQYAIQSGTLGNMTRVVVASIAGVGFLCSMLSLAGAGIPAGNWLDPDNLARLLILSLP
jgi:hypothetical protein